MGIPFYFRQVVQKNPGILRNTIPKCHRLYLDYNSIIHQCCAQVVNTKVWRNKNAMEEAMFRTIIQYTEYLISQARPQQLVYIGVDGVAPLAKIMQQRKRRHMSAMRNDKVNAFKKHNNIPFTLWDSNCITPGTIFMQKLQKTLESHFLSAPRSYEVVISSHEEEGEGEHKIIQYIKQLGDDGFTDVIYGLDADLMMLSMTCGKRRIVLMREANQIGIGHDNLNRLKYVDIDYLARCVQGEHDATMIFDYVCICFFLGNDFLPHIPALSIKNHGLDVLYEILVAAREELSTSLIVKNPETGMYEINMRMLSSILHRLSCQEESLLVDHIRHHQEAFDKATRLSAAHSGRSQNPVDAFLKDLESTPLKNPSNRTVKWHPELEPDTWKRIYYEVYFQEDVNNIKVIDKICLNYIHGLIWNVNYYFNQKGNNDWYYRSTGSPCITDINAYFQKTISTLGFIPNAPCSARCNVAAKHQLMMVLPWQSLHLLHPNTRSQVLDVRNGVCHLYPVTFKMHMDLKLQLWECTPILPPIDINKVLAL